MVIGNAKLFLDGKFADGSLTVENGVITAIGPADAPAEKDTPTESTPTAGNGTSGETEEPTEETPASGSDEFWNL